MPNNFIFQCPRRNNLFSIELAEFMIAVNEKRKEKTHKERKPNMHSLDSIVTLPPPLQVSSRLLFFPSTTSLPSSGLLFCLFSLNKEAERQGREGERKRQEENRDREKKIILIKCFLLSHNNTTHF